MCVAEFRGHMIASFFEICCRAFVRVPCCDCVRAMFVGGVIELAFVVFVSGVVYVIVVVVCFVGSVSFGGVFWWSSGWAALVCLGWFGFLVVFPVGGYGRVGFSVVVFVRLGFSVFVVRE